MTFFELVSLRQSVRKFDKNKPVEMQKLIACLEAARLAPSACNAQPWKFIVVEDQEIKEKVARQTYNSFFRFNKFVVNAPVIVVITLEEQNFTSKIGTLIKKIYYPLIDIGIAATIFCLQAQEFGLGTCMIGWFNEKSIKEILQIPKERKIGLLIAVGYPPEGYKIRQKQRKKLKEIMSYNKY